MPTAEAAPECTKCLNYGKTDGGTVHGTKKRKQNDPWTCYVVLLTQALCISTADAQVRRFKPSAAIDGQLLHFGSTQVSGRQSLFFSAARHAYKGARTKSRCKVLDSVFQVSAGVASKRLSLLRRVQVNEGVVGQIPIALDEQGSVFLFFLAIR